MSHKPAIAISSLFLAALAIASSCARAQDDMVVTYGAGGAMNSTLSGTSVEDFAGMAPGVYNNVNWAGVASIDQVSLVPNDQYGGIPTTGAYPVESISASRGSIDQTTITLNHSSSYFGLEWSAADAPNSISFYNSQGSLVAALNTATIFKQIPAGWPSPYEGNPNPAFLGGDYGEQFAFLNFIGAQGTTWDKIVLSNNNNGSGFETDNWTSRIHGWNPVVDGALPGTPVVQVLNGAVTQITKLPSSFVPSAPGAPAPPMTACLAFAGVLVLQALRNRGRREA